MEINHVAIEINKLSYTYPPPIATKAVKNITIQVYRGEVVALIGQNGSGKTTLARCMSGFLKPTNGIIYLDGQDIQKIAPSRQALSVGYVFQNPDHQLFKDTVWDDVAFGLVNVNTPIDIIEKKVSTILKNLDLYQHREEHPHRLAKGDKQRLAVAAIAVMEPPVIIVDEPTTGQDPQRARDVMDVLIDLNRKNNTTVIVISHAMNLIAEYASRVIALCQGEVLLDGSVREVFCESEVLSKTYVKPPEIVQLALALGIKPIPLSVNEAKIRLIERLSK